MLGERRKPAEMTGVHHARKRAQEVALVHHGNYPLRRNAIVKILPQDCREHRQPFGCFAVRKAFLGLIELEADDGGGELA